MQWMIYGATGYTGQLVVEEAIKRGHRPVIAGRNPDKLRPIAAQYDLEYVAFRLDDEATIAEAIADMDIVYHAAGPFIHTSEPMIRACLATRTHYLDITGEIRVFEQTFSYDEAARKNGILLISGAGYDVVPTDCAALKVAQQIPDATQLETAVFGFAGASAGTTKSFLEMAPEGFLARRNGQLVPARFGSPSITLTLPNGKKRFATSVPWGDLAVAYRTTGIPNITSYLAMPSTLVTLGQIALPIGQMLLRVDGIRNLMMGLVDRFVDGPDERTREQSRGYVWARVTGNRGQKAETWLELPEPYVFTARAAVRAVEETAESRLVGALSPAQTFGADFVTTIEGAHYLS